MPTVNAKIKALRLKKGLTLQQLATLTDLTKGYLSKIESAAQPPPVATIQAIARALGTDMDEFFGGVAPETGEESSNLDWLRARDASAAEPKRVYTYRPLVNHFRNKFMAPFLMRIRHGETDSFKHDSEEFLYVAEGAVDFLYEGKTRRLETGDGLYFNARVKHAFRNAGKRDAVLVAVNFNYKRF